MKLADLGVLAWERTGAASLRLAGTGQPALELRAAGPGALRCWLDQTGRFRAGSYAVDQFPAGQLEARQQGAQLGASSGGVYFTMDLSSGESWFGFRTSDRKEHRCQLSWEGTEVRMTFSVGAGEHFYGLGQDNQGNGHLDRRGSRRDLVTGQRIRSGQVTADIPVPFLLANDPAAGSYGVFFDSSHRLSADLAQSDPQAICLEASGGPLRFYLIAGPSPGEVVARYGALTGRPSLLPKWAYGFLQSRCSYQNWEEVEEVVSSFAARGLPLDGLFLDYDWAAHLHDFSWNSRFGPESPQKVAEYLRSGVHLILSNSGPMIRPDSPNHPSALELGLFVTDPSGQPVRCGHYGGNLLDVTAPGFDSWLWPQLRPLLKSGISGWWLDLTEPEGDPPEAIYRGAPRAEVHNIYSLLLTQSYFRIQQREAPERRPFILTRTGNSGIQRYGAVVWSGDTYSDYPTLAAHPPEALQASLCLIPWTCDSGGFISESQGQGPQVHLYRNDPFQHGRLYQRWLQFACFCPIMRAHHAGPASPFDFGELVEAGCRRYLELRRQLLPYIYTAAWRQHTEGLPMLRPLVFDYPEDPQTADLGDQFLFGDALLVAPVLEEAAVSRQVYFPAGLWIDWDSKLAYPPGPATVPAEADRIPLFVRAGSLIPLAPLVRAGYPPEERLEILVFPHGESQALLYQDAGDGPVDGSLSELRCRLTGRSLELRFAQRQGAALQQRLRFSVLIRSEPVSVRLGGALLERRNSAAGLALGGWTYLPHLGQLEIEVAAGPELQLQAALGEDPGDWPRAGAPAQAVPQRGAFLFPAPRLPARLNACDYDRGGQGIGYSTKQSGNAGDLYRWEDVNITLSREGGYEVFGLTEGEWLAYSFFAPQGGRWQLQVRALAESAEAELRLELAGAIYPLRAGGGSWQDLGVQVTLQAGEQTLRVEVGSGRVRLHHIDMQGGALRAGAEEV